MTARYAVFGAVKTLSLLLTVLLIAVCLFFGWLFVCNAVGMQVPTLGPLQMYVVLSDSMSPVFLADDAIIIAKTDPEKLETGDIITFYAFETSEIVTHRIAAVSRTARGAEFTTKGDNNNIEDSFTTPGDRVIGRYLGRIPQFGTFLETTTSKPYLIAVAVVAILAVQFVLGAAEKLVKPRENSAAPAHLAGADAAPVAAELSEEGGDGNAQE